MMTIQQSGNTLPTSTRSEYSWLQRAVLRRSHPVAIVCNTIGVIWTVYFLWHRNWGFALSSFVFAKILAVFFSRNTDCQALGESLWGRIALLHLQPWNVVVQLIGVVVGVVGISNHETCTILGGLSLIILGHWVGWSKVDPRFSLGGSGD